MNLLYLTVLFPLLGYVILSWSRGRLSENLAAVVGVGSLFLSAFTTAFVGYHFLTAPPEAGVFTQTLWTWINVDGFAPRVSFHLDGLALTMLGVITGVGALIHLFASWYMRGEEGYSRFFSYMNLFVASMVVLVLADNLLLLYLGWEGVGLCSYLLIGFYYKEKANGAAAQKAFIVTRIGDVFMALGLFMLYRETGTLDIPVLLDKAPELFTAGSVTINLIALMLLGGAVGKSAQMPLQTWLADAMAGPTPVSALIHAATMVTAGVYLIARTHPLFLLAPGVLNLVGIIGAFTLLIAGFSALVQTDIKRILAYSTMSQIGYMFLALGVGAWQPAIFHLMTHAFFKALLFLSSGAVILACHHEQNIFRMGGLYKQIPLVYVCFLVGGAALVALPFVTVGFYSKDEILWETYASHHEWLLLCGWIGAFMTSLYTLRLIFVAFHGPAQIQAHGGHGIAYGLPLVVLLVLSTGVGALIHPPLQDVLPLGAGHDGGEMKHWIELWSGAIAVAGVVLAALLFAGERRMVKVVAANPAGRALSSLWYQAWGFDRLYDVVFTKPFLWLSNILASDLLDRLTYLIAGFAKAVNLVAAAAENGQVRSYAASIAIGALLTLLILIAL
ncbi:MAG TPA: NADH-quinone oxidoreductase subunit L [Candidatus Kapabacteria bacterium]|nr:NADH-quinone oxidoreductase subunit L [Candidatus Kapabacteria bacterium]